MYTTMDLWTFCYVISLQISQTFRFKANLDKRRQTYQVFQRDGDAILTTDVDHAGGYLFNCDLEEPERIQRGVSDG